MSIQILSIVIYSHDGQRREVPLRAGKVNIITGSSKTGKSALIEVVNYCFCSGKCEVPEGPIRRAVSWYGLKLQLVSGQAFIARRCPGPLAQSSEDCFVIVADEVAIPMHEELKQTTNTKGLLSLFNQWTGITENLHEPPPSHTRAALAANIRHALLLCFQPQDEIIRRQQLFHMANDRFMADAIRDTLPYFLGAVDDDYVTKRAEIRTLREQLRGIERQLSELRSLRGEGVSKAAGLLAQARDIGLTDRVVDTWEETIVILQEIAKTPLASLDQSKADTQVGAELTRLNAVRRDLLDAQQRVREEISSIKEVEKEERGYAREAAEQYARLVPIGIFGDQVDQHSCPLCTQVLPETNVSPTVERLRSELGDVAQQLDSVTSVSPQVVNAVAELEERLQSIRSRLAKNREETESVRAANTDAKAAAETSTARAHILGRVALYVESMPTLPNTKSLESQAQQLRDQCAGLEEQLSDERVQERLTSITALIGQKMTEWSKELQLEHADALLRLDLKKLTIVADTADGPVPMDRMGSGENWVSYHLMSHLALHAWFTVRNRPVPRFLFLDQPSQVYFPPEKDPDGTLNSGKEEDRLAVTRMFALIFEALPDLYPGFQVILTEHADINEPWYQEAVVQRWRGGVKLVPEEWPRV